MTHQPGDDRSQVETVAVRGRPRDRIVASGAVVIVLLAAVAMAGLLGRGGSPEGSLDPSSRAAFGGASSTASARPSGPSTAPSRSAQAATPGLTDTPRPSLETPPTFANVALPGSPEIVLFQRDGDDIKVLGWRAGEPDLATRQTVQGAARGIIAQQTLQTTLSPDGSLLLVHALPATNGGPDTFRVFRLDGSGGREIWQSTSLGSGLSAGFAPSGQLIVTQPGLGRRDRGWTIVDLSGNKPALHEIPLPPFPVPVPSASRDLRTLTINYAPLAMSADGKWVYAMSVHATEPQYRPAYRISVETGDAEGIDALPTTGPSRVVSPSVDRLSGRYLLAGPLTTSGEGFVQAWSPGAAAPDFQAELGILFVASWMDDGGVIVGEYDHLPGPFHFRVMTLTAKGDVARTYFTADGTNAGLVGVYNGFAVAYNADTGSGTRTLVTIRLSDGATSGVEVTDPDGLAFNLGIRP
jgi:hypothetical protein